LFGEEPVSQKVEVGLKNNSVYLFDKKYNMIKSAKKTLFGRHQPRSFPKSKPPHHFKKTVPVNIKKEEPRGAQRVPPLKRVQSYDHLLDNVDWLSMGLLDRNIDGYNDCLNGYYGNRNTYLPRKVGCSNSSSKQIMGECASTTSPSNPKMWRRTTTSGVDSSTLCSSHTTICSI
jgi:hypothetical protein